jgi:hypothetical protein
MKKIDRKKGFTLVVPRLGQHKLNIERKTNS